MNGNTALHLLLEDDINFETHNKINMFSILLKLIEHTDLNIINMDGMTCLHLIAMKNLFTIIL